jgi:hypothetical protein
MLGQQRVAHAQDRLPVRRVGRLERQVALGVEAHRALGEVGRADDQQPVVDHHQLGVDVDRDLGMAGNLVDRIEDAQPVVAADAAQLLAELVAAAVHHPGLEEAFAQVGRDDHDLGPVVLGEARGQRLRDRRHGQILVLQIDDALRQRDRLEEQGLDLARLGLLAEARPGAGDRDRGVLEPGRDAVRPGRRAPRRRRVDALAGRALPALAGELLEAARGLAHDHQHAVVERPRVAPVGLVGPVLGAVPAPGREVEAAAKGERAVDHHQLLVLAGAGRVVAVELEAQPAQPAELAMRQELAVEREEHQPVPDQQADAQVVLRPQQVGEEAVERQVAAVGVEADLAADVPAEDEDAVAGPAQGLVERGVVGRAVDQQRRAPGPGQPPAGALAERGGDGLGGH